MSPRPVPASGGGVHAALASATRRRLLELLQAAATPCDVHDLGRATGLHTSTVRFHLETLRGAGLVIRKGHAQGGIGRPRTTYVAAERGRSGTAYQGLSELLSANLSDSAEERATRAEGIGLLWAQQVVPVQGGVGATMDEAVAQVRGLFDQLGFAPEVSRVGPDHQIALHACPFRAVAREHPEVVCAVHRGLLLGSLKRLGAHAAGQLLPFVEPELCTVYLSSAD